MGQERSGQSRLVAIGEMGAGHSCTMGCGLATNAVTLAKQSSRKLFAVQVAMTVEQAEALAKDLQLLADKVGTKCPKLRRISDADSARRAIASFQWVERPHFDGDETTPRLRQ